MSSRELVREQVAASGRQGSAHGRTAQHSAQQSQRNTNEIANTTNAMVGNPTGKTTIEMLPAGWTGMTVITRRYWMCRNVGWTSVFADLV